MDATIKKVEKSWGGKNAKFQRAVDEWKAFREHSFPKEQDAKEYVKAHPAKYHVPFKAFFASPDNALHEHKSTAASTGPCGGQTMLQAVSQPSVRYSTKCLFNSCLSNLLT